MSSRRKKKLTSTALGALAGTALFNAVFLFLNSREMAGVTHVPNLFESLSIYAFFFAVLWLSAGPLADAEHS
jgi:hypothetical protein